MRDYRFTKLRNGQSFQKCQKWWLQKALKKNRYGKKLHYLGCKGSKAHSEGNK
jgi:hypothetical protein